MISAQPIALQLRFLQTMKEISSEHNTKTILPVPINLLAQFTKRSESRTPKRIVAGTLNQTRAIEQRSLA